MTRDHSVRTFPSGQKTSAWSSAAPAESCSSPFKKTWFFYRAQRGLLHEQCSSLRLCLCPRPSATAMALTAIVPLVALASLCAAVAPNCDDMVKPYIPQDPYMVRHAFFWALIILPRLQSWTGETSSAFLCEGFWKMGVCDGSRGPPSIPQSTGIAQKFLDGAGAYFWCLYCDLTLGRLPVVSVVMKWNDAPSSRL